MTTELQQCRFCLETYQTLDNPFLSPCICSGSVRYVHKSCLKTWVILDDGINAEICNLCKTPYTIDVRPVLERIPSRRRLIPYILSNFSYISVLTLYTIIIYHLYNARNNSFMSFSEVYLHSHYTAGIITHINFLCMFYTEWKVHNRELYWKLLLDGHTPYVVGMHILLTLSLYANKNMILPNFTYLLWNKYWKDHIKYLHAINDIMSH